MPPCARPRPTEPSLACRISSTPTRASSDAGHRLTTTFLLAVDDAEYLVHVAAGRLAAVERGPFLLRSWSFAVRAPADAWARFWRPLPEPGYHDIFAMKKLGVARVEGDLWPLMAHLRYVKDVLAAPASRAGRELTPCSSRSSGATSTSPSAGVPTACTSRRPARAGRSSAFTPRARTGGSSGTS